MKKLLTLIVALMLATISTFGLTACSDTNVDDGIVDVRTKTVTVGYTDYAPMNYTDENGTLVGFDTELAIMVFNALGYNVRFKLIDWNNKYIELDGGNVDCLWNGFTANTADDDGVQRSEKVDFSYYYMTNAQCIVRKSTTADISEFADFDTKSVSFELGSAGQTFVDAIEENINKKGVTSQMDAIKNVNLGTSDYAVVDVLLAKSIAGKGDYTDLVINEGLEIEGEYYAIGFKKGSELTAKVNVMLEAYAKTGYLAELAAKYDLSDDVITNFEDQQ